LHRRALASPGVGILIVKAEDILKVIYIVRLLEELDFSLSVNLIKHEKVELVDDREALFSALGEDLDALDSLVQFHQLLDAIAVHVDVGHF